MATSPDPLASLRVWERLEVGPVRLEPRRLRVPYRLRTRAGASETIELSYRYEEDVFDASAESEQLASMASAQVALNYGLFCDEIVFHGAYDAHDMAFLEKYAEHTAREIYAVKFLRENEFLTGDAARLEPVVAERYMHAKISFHQTPVVAGRAQLPSRHDVPRPSPDRYAVLSSGGKDSLLTYGLMRELGLAPHPIFVNESGRHWFTALNAYRHLRDVDPNTARVWTNSDRVFAWMLRRLPFVRPDFANVRSDEYPIRLWTVAGFLFGALPLLRARGLGRLLIGDEHDCTVRRTDHGITNYDGLFDQSRYFDNALTRYFHAKGWDIQQFSVLRPLSELLIEKTLAERYPDLQAHQVSCHATHTEGARIRPCGKCEKCRRVVGMLVAVGADAERCGYTRQQVGACLASLSTAAVRQERAGAEHMVWLLEQSGVATAAGAEPHPEVMQLRFHGERSPFQTIPTDLRAPLYGLLLQHAAGAVIRDGCEWLPVDPVSPEAMTPRYLLEGGGERVRRMDEADNELGFLTWPQARERLAQVDIALLPVGATEQHGPHLTLDTDAHDALRLAQDVAAACTQPRPLVLPLIPYGVSYHHDDFAGTISVSPDTLAKLVHEIGMAVARNGIRKLIIINGHGGNVPALHFAAQNINRDARIFTCVDTGESSDADIAEIAGTPNDVHAGEIETSTSLYLRPERVDMSLARRAIPRFSSPYLDFTSHVSVGWYGRTSRISRSGVMGDPTLATAEKGEKMWQLMIDHLVALVEDLKHLTLDEIHQRKI